MTVSHWRAAAVAVCLAVLLPGCSTTAKVTNEGSEPTVASAQVTKLGTTVRVGDWEVKVTKVNTKADKLIRHANMFNQKPKGQYVLVDYTATYRGDDRKSDARLSLLWTLTDNSSKVHDQASAVPPAYSADQPTSARKGGTVKGQAVFDVKKARLAGSLITVDEVFGDDYADFPIS